MQHNIRCNIFNVANQLFFAYQGIVLELQVFVSLPTELTKAIDFICTLEEKQELWYKMITNWLLPTGITIELEGCHPPLTSFFSQVNPLKSFPVTNPNNTYPGPAILAKAQTSRWLNICRFHACFPNHPCAFSSTSVHATDFGQTFMSQCQYYPLDAQQKPSTLLLLPADCDNVSAGASLT